MGNIEWIKDWVAADSEYPDIPQQQDFTYDDLDRLVTAEVTGGIGGTYSQKTYSYDTSTGNLISKEGVSYTYGDSNHPHAVTSLSNGWDYSYDANGNQTSRGDGSTDYTLTYDVENRLDEVDGDAAATFVYDGDGNRVKGTVGSVTTIYVGEYYEVEMGTPDIIRKYYYAGGARIAMRENSTLYWLLTDHLGSIALTINSDGGLESEKRYMPWGETRYEWEGTNPPDTSYQFTGQRQEKDLGIYFYHARWYDPALGRFIQADTIVPNFRDPQSYNRFGYVNNNPVNYTDPTGNFNQKEIIQFFGLNTWDEVLSLFQEGGAFEGLFGWLAILELAEVDDIVVITLSNGEIVEGRFLTSDEGNLYIVSNGWALSPEDLIQEADEFKLFHDEGGVGKRISHWSAIADNRTLSWIGYETDILGSLGPPPGKPILHVGQVLIVSNLAIIAAEMFQLGGELIRSSPSYGPWAIVPAGTGLFLQGAATVMTIIMFNTASAPTSY